MNFDKIKKVNEELDKLPLITEKLNYWKTKYFDKYPTPTALHEFFESKSAEELGGNISDGLMGELRLPVTQNMLIPCLDSPNYGVPEEIRIEYYNWMVNFLAERRFIEAAKPYYKKELTKPVGKFLIQGELERIKTIQSTALKQLKSGEIDFYSQKNITAEKLYLWFKNDYYSQHEFRVENRGNMHVKSVCTHKYVYPYLSELIPSNKKKKHTTELLKLNGINIPKLVVKLQQSKFVDENDKIRLQNWLKGFPVKDPININKPMSHFASLIADLKEADFIKNNKTFCKNLIHASLLFENKTTSPASIKNALNENSTTRIHKSDTGNYIDIKDFILKK